MQERGRVLVYWDGCIDYIYWYVYIYRFSQLFRESRLYTELFLLQLSALTIKINMFVHTVPRSFGKNSILLIVQSRKRVLAFHKVQHCHNGLMVNVWKMWGSYIGREGDNASNAMSRARENKTQWSKNATTLFHFILFYYLSKSPGTWPRRNTRSVLLLKFIFRIFKGVNSGNKSNAYFRDSFFFTQNVSLWISIVRIYINM